MSSIKSVLVFCSSSREIGAMYFGEMDLLARELVKRGIRIVYGGASLGLMGRLADSALKAGGQVVGVIPMSLANPATQQAGLTETIVVNDLLDRKRKMLSLADAVIVSPGGLGTLDEVTEILALKQLKAHDKPVFFHNFLDFWRPQLEFFEELRARAMILEDPSTLYTVCDSAEQLGAALEAYTPAHA